MSTAIAANCSALFEHLSECSKSEQETDDVLALELIYNQLLEAHQNLNNKTPGADGSVRKCCKEEYMSQFDQLVIHSAAELPAFAGGFHVIGHTLHTLYSCCSPNCMNEGILESLKEFWVALCTHFVLYMEEISSTDDQNASSASAEVVNSEDVDGGKLLPHEEAALRR